MNLYGIISEEFAACINIILADPALRDEMGKVGRQTVEIAFSWDSVASRLTQLYNNLLNSAKLVPKNKSNIAA